MPERRFVTAINCIDGRVTEPVIRWMTRRLAADYVDLITEPGPDALLAAGARPQMESIQSRVHVSLNAHASRAVAIVGHHDCAGNPVDDDDHIRHIQQSAELLNRWGLGVRILGLWVNRRWTVEVVCDSEGTFV